MAEEIRQYESFFQNLVHLMIVLHQVHLEGLSRMHLQVLDSKE
jgi:hypothetical protein